MWNPFQTRGGVVLNLLGPGTVDVGDQRAAILICYEQLLTWPMLRSAIEKPTLLIASVIASNPAMRDHFKTGQMSRAQDLNLF